jgi:hypothetical protein
LHPNPHIKVTERVFSQLNYSDPSDTVWRVEHVLVRTMVLRVIKESQIPEVGRDLHETLNHIRSLQIPSSPDLHRVDFAAA